MNQHVTLDPFCEQLLNHMSRAGGAWAAHYKCVEGPQGCVGLAQNDKWKRFLEIMVCGCEPDHHHHYYYWSVQHDCKRVIWTAVCVCKALGQDIYMRFYFNVLVKKQWSRDCSVWLAWLTWLEHSRCWYRGAQSGGLFFSCVINKSKRGSGGFNGKLQTAGLLVCLFVSSAWLREVFTAGRAFICARAFLIHESMTPRVAPGLLAFYCCCVLGE